MFGFPFTFHLIQRFLSFIILVELLYFLYAITSRLLNHLPFKSFVLPSCFFVLLTSEEIPLSSLCRRHSKSHKISHIFTIFLYVHKMLKKKWSFPTHFINKNNFTWQFFFLKPPLFQWGRKFYPKSLYVPLLSVNYQRKPVSNHKDPLRFLTTYCSRCVLT